MTHLKDTDAARRSAGGILPGAQEARRRGAQPAARRRWARSSTTNIPTSTSRSTRVEAHGMPRALLVAPSRSRCASGCCMCRREEGQHPLGERPERIFVEFLLRAAGQSRHLRARPLRRASEPERRHARRLDRHQRAAGLRPARRRARRSAEDRGHADRRRRPHASACPTSPSRARLRGSRHLSDPPPRRAGAGAGGRDAGWLERPRSRQGRWTPRRKRSPPSCRSGRHVHQGHRPGGQHP